MTHEPVSSPVSPFLVGMVAAVVLALFARESRAEQFVLLDAMIDYTWDDAVNSTPSKSHFYVNEGNFLNKNRPTNWLSPVDYRNGTLHVRAEVFVKPPGTQTTGWTLCYIPNAGGYGCADTTYYTSTGVWERETKMTSWWNNSQLQWDKGVKQVDMIYAINDSGSGHITNYPELKDKTTPTKVRVTMVQVSAGSTYDPTLLGFSRDGGAPDAAKPNDGGATGTGGAMVSGSGGRDGSGGAMVSGSGGADGSGGAAPSSSTGGSTGASTGSGGSGNNPPSKPGSSAGSGSVTGSCAISSSTGDGGFGATAGLALGLIVWARRRRRRRAQR
jgi:MYXO-CTERM domain-containing protein